ncbi:MAG: hypothetical protein V4469_02495 [Patescibacteria group bacterium]
MEQQVQTFEHLTEAEQKAWHRVANELVFVNDPNIDLTQSNVDQISETIQREMLELPVTQAGKIKSVHDSISQTFEKLGIDPAGIKVTGEQTKTLDDINNLARVNAIDSYQGWGFTPRLAEDPEGGSALNCLGKAIALGTDLKDEGFAVRMAITPDHPYIAVEFEGKNYLLGYQTETPLDMESLTIERKDGFEIVRIETNKDNDGQSRILLVVDFNQAVVHEILENIAVLERISKQEDIYLLPGTDQKGQAVATKHKDTLEAADWKLVQGKILPHMRKMFENDEWKKEVVRMQEVRDEQYRAKFWDSAFNETDEVLNERLEDAERKISRAELIQQTKQYPIWMYDYVTGNVPMDEKIPLELLVFADILKSKLLKESPKIQEQLKARLRKNLSI